MSNGEVSELGEWNFIYGEPSTLFSDSSKVRNPDAGSESFLACPAMTKSLKRTYVFTNPVHSEYEYSATSIENVTIKPLSKTFMGLEMIRKPTLLTGPTMVYKLQYIFFASESLTAKFTPPYFHKAKHTVYGSIVPGEYDIGQWFRPYVCELQLWNTSGDLIIEKDEPIMYAEFMTDKKVTLKRFVLSKELYHLSTMGSKSISTFGRGVSLEERYRIFGKTRTKDVVLKEIQKNLLD
jgi:hypothetical protein